MKTTSALRQLLRQPGIIEAPGAYDCFTTKLIEREGFPVVYMTGAGTAVTRGSRLLQSRGAVIPGLATFGLPAARVRRAWEALM